MSAYRQPTTLLLDFPIPPTNESPTTNIDFLLDELPIKNPNSK